MTLSGGGLLLYLAHLGAQTITEAGFYTGASLMLPTLAFSSYYYAKSSGHGLRPGPIIKGIMHDLRRLLPTKYLQSTMYTALTANFLLVGASYIATPELTLDLMLRQSPPEAQFLLEHVGGSMLLLAPWSYNLK
ncbi:hypothetical protein WJX72_001960, partial [[Myrmecia] bisecta]